jgi:GT2 family glycosyltransferase
MGLVYVQQRPDLSVIVVTHNRAALALQTLQAARQAIHRLAVQWLVVDSGSTDGTPEAIARRWPDIEVQRLGNIGFAAGCNKALRAARGRYVLLLNPDCVIVDGRLDELIDALDSLPRVGIASVLQRAPDGSLMLSIRRYPSLRTAIGEALTLWRWSRLRGWREEETRPECYGTIQSSDWLVGAFLIARLEAVAQVGPLDERFFLYSEETDWCYRFRTAGWDVAHLPMMTTVHHTAPSYRPDLMAQLSHAKILFARKHYSAPRAGAIRAGLALRHLLRTAVAGSLAAARPDAQDRALAERRALAVVLGRSRPPFAVPALPPRRGGSPIDEVAA